MQWHHSYTPSVPVSHVGRGSFERSNAELGPASPGTVGALTDEQGVPRAADGTVALVPILIIKEEGFQEIVLNREQRLSMPSPPPVPSEYHCLPAYLTRGTYPPLK